MISSALKSSKSRRNGSPVEFGAHQRSVKSTNIDEGFFTPNPTNKIGYMTVKDKSDKSKKEV